MLWSIVSNVFCKSKSTVPVRRPESKPFVILSWKYDKKLSFEWNFQKTDWNLYRTLLSDRKFIVWSWIICCAILEISGSRKMGLKFFGPVLRPFLYKDLILATFHLSGKKASLMERLQILAIVAQSVFEPSLRNLLTWLYTPVALLVLNSFNVFKTDTELTLSNLIFFSWKLVPL